MSAAARDTLNVVAALTWAVIAVILTKSALLWAMLELLVHPGQITFALSLAVVASVTGFVWFGLAIMWLVETIFFDQK